MTEKEIVRTLLNILRNHNINYEVEKYCYASIADVVIEDKQIAIEAKLHNIKKAIIQLIGHHRKYESIFLYMPYNKAGLVEKYKTTLKKHNIRWFFINDREELVFGHGSWKKILLG